MTDTTTITHDLHGPCGGKDDRVTVRSLVEDGGVFGAWWKHGPGLRQFYVNHDDDTSGVIYSPRSYSYGDSDIVLVEVPHTLWGDYVGDCVTRANYIAFLESYADDVVELKSRHGAHALALPLDGTVSSVLADEIRGLVEYPLVDEDTHCTLELQLELEDWDSYGKDDLRAHVERKLEKLRDSEEGTELEAALQFLPNSVTDAPSDGVLLRLVDRARETGGVTWECETAVGGFFRGLEELADAIVAARSRAIVRRFARFLSEEYGETPGQLQLS